MKTILQILAFAPAAIITYISFGIFSNPDFHPPLATEGTFWGDWWWGTIGFVTMVITGIFLVHLLINKNVPKDKKAL